MRDGRVGMPGTFGTIELFWNLRPRTGPLACLGPSAQLSGCCVSGKKTTSAIHSLESHAQEAAVREAAATAHALLLRAEALRRTLLAVGADYRTLFAWLLTLCRRVNRDPPPAAAAAAAFRADPHALAAFVRGAFSHDPIAPQLASEVCSLPMVALICN